MLSPSERLWASLKRFFLLRRLDPHRVARGLWVVTLIGATPSVMFRSVELFNLVKATWSNQRPGFGLTAPILNYVANLSATFALIFFIRLVIEVSLTLIEFARAGRQNP